MRFSRYAAPKKVDTEQGGSRQVELKQLDTPKDVEDANDETDEEEDEEEKYQLTRTNQRKVATFLT
jgi:hypothetical protein